MEDVFKVIGAIVCGIAVVTGISLAMAFPTKWIVNWLFSDVMLLTIFGHSSITVWQAWGLNFLCSTLFKASYQSQK